MEGECEVDYEHVWKVGVVFAKDLGQGHLCHAI